MIDEADVKREFLHGPLDFKGAIIALQKMGYSKEEADRVVSEWADDGDAANDNDRNEGYDITDSDFDEQMGGY